MTGEFKQTDFEKTIMLVGATGSGKSTIIDGIVNYVMGVNFDDPFRFTLKEEDQKKYKVLFLNHFVLNQIILSVIIALHNMFRCNYLSCLGYVVYCFDKGKKNCLL